MSDRAILDCVVRATATQEATDAESFLRVLHTWAESRDELARMMPLIITRYRQAISRQQAPPRRRFRVLYNRND